MAQQAAGTSAASGAGRPLVWWYLVVTGVYLLITAITGFAYTTSFGVGPTAKSVGSSQIFGVFETNGWHNLAGLVNGVSALGFAMTPTKIARLGAIFIGFASGVVAILLFAWPSQPLLASNGADQVIHVSVAVGGIAAGLLTKPDQG
jgi:hypothetical protein